jgi:hypothetical protein
METHEVLQQIKTALANVQADGKDFVHIPTLKQFLNNLEKDATLSSEMRMLQHESNLEWYKAQSQADVEMFKSVIQAGQTALRTSFLVNGGAAVALLAFIGNVWAQTQTLVVAKALTLSLSLFSAGVLIGAVATGTTYISQAFFARAWEKTGYGFQFLTIALVIAAYSVFGGGIWFARKAFLTHLAP